MNDKSMRVLITGGTGLIGRSLSESLLADGHTVVNLSRGGKPSGKPGLLNLKWDGKVVPSEAGDVDAVVNLAGASITGQRWTESYKQVLVDSRVDATKACVDYIKRLEIKPSVFLTASGYNYYGSLPEGPLDEKSPAGDGFMSRICQAWEGASEGSGVRTVRMRISVVLDKDDGPLAKMVTPYKFFVGGPTGTGDQGFPWIHVDDMVSAMRFLIGHQEISGPVNMVSPQPITNQQYSNALGKVLHRPNFFRLGKGLLGLVFGEMSVVLWGGAVVLPKVLKDSGFKWKFVEIEPALRDLLG